MMESNQTAPLDTVPLDIEALYAQLRANQSINLQLSHSQQRAIIDAVSLNSVFDTDTPLAERQAACRVILNPSILNANRAAHNTENVTLTDTRRTLQNFYQIGGPAEDFLAGRSNTTLAEMYQFYYYLLAAVFRNSGAAVTRGDIPAAPTGTNRRYNQQQNPIQAQQPQVFAAPTDPVTPPAVPRTPFAQVFWDATNFARRERPRSPEEREALQALSSALDVMREEFRAEDHGGRRRVNDAIDRLQRDAITWVENSRDLDNLLDFRTRGNAFFQNNDIRAHYVTASFFCDSESTALQDVRVALRSLRELSNKHAEINIRAHAYIIAPLPTAASFGILSIFSIFDCIEMMSLFPFFDMAGFLFPMLKSSVISIFLAETLWEMPWNAWREYLEASSTTLFVYIPLFLLSVFALSSLSGLCVALLVPGLEILPMMALYAAQSLVVSTLTLALPSLFVLLGRGLYEGGKGLYNFIFEDGIHDDLYHRASAIPA
jgi:hypothetical protein